MRRMVTIAGTEETVLKPVVNTIAKDLLHILKLNDVEDFTVSYNGIPILKEYYSGSSTVDKSLKSNLLEVTLKEEPLQELELTRVPIHPDTVPFFKDSDTNTRALTAYRSIKINFNFLLKSKSRSFINKVIDLLHMYKIDGAMHNHHNIQISYQIPNVTKEFIKEIYDIKNSVEPEDIKVFMDKTFNKKCIDLYESLDANLVNSTLAAKEYQTDVLGYFMGEFTEVDKDKDGIYFTLPLNYMVTYQKPIAVHMEFPYLIYNKKLSDKFMPPKIDYVKRNFRNHEKEITEFLDKRPTFGINKQGYYLTYPRNDEFTVRDKLYGYCPIISMLCTVDKNDPRDLFNINFMGGIDFIDIVKEFIILQKDYVTKINGSLFYFSIYEDDCLKSNLLTLDGLGNLRTVKDMCIKSTYRVLIYICSDISVIQYPNRKVILDFLNQDVFNNTNNNSNNNNNNSGNESDVSGNNTTFLDSYLSFFNLDKSKVWDMYQKLKDKTPGGLILKLKLAEYEWPKYNAQHHTEVYRLLKE